MREFAGRGHHHAQKRLLIPPGRATIIPRHSVSRVIHKTVDCEPAAAYRFDQPLYALGMGEILRNRRRNNFVLAG